MDTFPIGGFRILSFICQGMWLLFAGDVAEPTIWIPKISSQGLYFSDSSQLCGAKRQRQANGMWAEVVSPPGQEG